MASYIYHHGIKGQRWGVRRYQNEDGTLTEAGRRRAGRADTKAALRSLKNARNLYDNEVRRDVRELSGLKGNAEDYLNRELRTRDAYYGIKNGKYQVGRDFTVEKSSKGGLSKGLVRGIAASAAGTAGFAAAKAVDNHTAKQLDKFFTHLIGKYGSKFPEVYASGGFTKGEKIADLALSPVGRNLGMVAVGALAAAGVGLAVKRYAEKRNGTTKVKFKDGREFTNTRVPFLRGQKDIHEYQDSTGLKGYSGYMTTRRYKRNKNRIGVRRDT